ncbi:MAG: GTPase Era [Verrucomicrobia bacterium]|nr:GTPase Era [Verrucomicrobiota bacterium]
MSNGSPETSLRCGIVALVGCANVGKSSLLNRIVQEKVSIVSNVAQTTRNMVRAIHSEARGQLVFLDTPGMHKASYDLGKIMNRTARASISGSDVALLVLDPTTHVWDEDEGWMRKLLRAEENHLVFVMNKHDLAWKFEQAYRALWQRLCDESGISRPVAWMTVSAQTGEGIDDLLSVLFDAVPIGPALFPEEMLTDFPRNIAIADIVREKYFKVLRDEIPHDLAVRVDDIKEEGDGWVVYADILINRPSQKGIIIGQKGRLLRKVKREAELDLESMYGRKVELKLWVKVEKGWTKNHFLLKQLGYIE